MVVEEGSIPRHRKTLSVGVQVALNSGFYETGVHLYQDLSVSVNQSNIVRDGLRRILRSLSRRFVQF